MKVQHFTNYLFTEEKRHFQHSIKLPDRHPCMFDFTKTQQKEKNIDIYGEGVCHP